MIKSQEEQKHHGVAVIILGLILMFIPAQVRGQDMLDFGAIVDPNTSDDDLLSMDFADLLDIEVGVVSKKTEGISEAPGIVTVISAKEIKAFGYKTLGDILNRAPSMLWTSGSYIFFNQVLVRGHTPHRYDTHTLVLIDGRPARENTMGGTNAPLYFAMPVEAIEHIEIIRGPGSVLYGTNAFSGVINVVLKKSRTEKEGVIAGSYGSFSTRTGVLQYGFMGEDWNVYLTAKEYDELGDVIEYKDEYGDPRRYNLTNQYTSVMANAQYKQFSLKAFMLDYNPYRNAFEILDHHFVDFGFSQPLGENLTANFNITFNNNRFAQSFYSWDHYYNSHSYLYEGNIMGSFGDKFNFVFGGTAENVRFYGDWAPNGSLARYSSYLQADWRPFKQVKLIAGAQLNKPDNTEYDISPRVGMVVNVNENWSTKLLFSEAFRSATPTEMHSLYWYGVAGNPDLSPETVKTYEAQVMYEKDNIQSSVTFFQSNLSKTIVRQPSDDLPSWALKYENGGGHHFWGLEWEGKWGVNERLSLLGSAFYQDDRGGHDQPNYAFPDILLKVGLIYERERWSLGLFDNYIGNIPEYRLVPAEDFYQNPPAGNQHFMTANFQYDLSGWLDKPDDTVELSIFVDNLLNDTHWFPETGYRNLNTMPWGTSLGIFGKLTIRF
ncbi:MAG: TonB-dependent receptor [Planctomycetes bacterium]|nr:TonB-dependent receptor [Planctomycetota bacterium]